MPAKFEDLPLEAHSLICRHLNHDDRFEMRQTCSIWRNFLKYEVEINESTVRGILRYIKNEKASLDFTYVRVKRSNLTNQFYGETYELLGIICHRVIYLVCSDRDNLDIYRMMPNLKIIKVNYSKDSYRFDELNEPPFSYLMNITKNFMEFPTLFLMESYGHYLQAVSLTNQTEAISTEVWQRAISTWKHLRVLHFNNIGNVEFLKMWAIHLPAGAPLKTLKIHSQQDFTDIFELFCKKYANSLDVIDLRHNSRYGVIPLAPLKHLKALHKLKLRSEVSLARWELYNAIVGEFSNNLKQLCIINITTSEEEMISILENLPHLRKLELCLCSAAVTDRTLATIFSKLTRLRVLCLKGYYEFTDAGFLGFGDTPYPISRLRGLTQLGIGYNKNITKRILTEIVRLKELRDIWLGEDYLYSYLLPMLSVNCCAQLRNNIIVRMGAIDDDMVHEGINYYY